MGPRTKRVIQRIISKRKTEFIYNKEHHQVIKDINKKYVQELKRKHITYKKQEEEQELGIKVENLIKKRLSDIDMLEQKILDKNKKTVNKNKLQTILNDLKTPKLLLHDDNCNRFNAKRIAWPSPTYVIRHIRSCLLNHDWNNLTSLLLFLLNHKTYYLSYAKEISFLHFLVNNADYNAELLEEFLEKCFVRVDANHVSTPYNIYYESMT